MKTKLITTALLIVATVSFAQDTLKQQHILIPNARNCRFAPAFSHSHIFTFSHLHIFTLLSFSPFIKTNYSL